MALLKAWDEVLAGTRFNYFVLQQYKIGNQLPNSGMAHLLTLLMSLSLTIFLFISGANAARDTDSYDGNIFPIYAGNGSLVPPPNRLANSLDNKRTSVIVFYLDDSATSKAFAPVVSGLKLLWGSSIDLIPITTDEFQGNVSNDPTEESSYWHGNIPQVVVIDGNGNLVLDQEGQIPIDTINKAISKATGLDEPSFSIKIKTLNEYNSEPSKDGYTDPR